MYTSQLSEDTCRVAISVANIASLIKPEAPSELALDRSLGILQGAGCKWRDGQPSVRELTRDVMERVGRVRTLQKDAGGRTDRHAPLASRNGAANKDRFTPCKAIWLPRNLRPGRGEGLTPCLHRRLQTQPTCGQHGRRFISDQRSNLCGLLRAEWLVN